MDIVELGFRVDTRDIATASNDLDRLGEAGSAAEGSLGGLAASVAGVAALIAGGIGLSEMARNSREFSDAMAEVSTLVDTATFNIGELADEALRMAAEFGSAPVEQSKAFYQAISAGASTAEQAITALDAANRLAVGGVTSVEVAVDGLTSVMNAYGGEAGSFTDISDTMFVGMKGGKTTIEELSQSIGKLAPLASTAGASFDEVIAATAALTKGGVATSTAMDGLRAIMAAVVKPSGEAADMAAELGIRFNAAGLQSMGLAGFLEHLADKTGGSTEKLAVLFGGVEALTPALALTGKSSADFAAILGDMGNKAGETQAAFDKMAASPGFQMDRILSSLSAGFTGLGTSIFDSAAPALKSIADTIPAAFAAVDDAISGAQTAWQTFADAFRFSDDRVFVMLRDVGSAIQQIGIYAAPVVPYLDDFAFALVGIGAGAVVITGLAAAFALLTSPITLTVAAVGALAVATTELYRNWDAVSAWWGGIWGGMKTTAETFVNWWNTTPIEDREIIIDATSTEIATTAVQGFATYWNGLPFMPQALVIETDTVNDATTVVADFISSTANGIAGLADDILAADIGGALSGMWDEAKAGADKAWGEITIALGYAFGDIKGLIDEVKLTVAALFDGPSNIGAIFEAGWDSIVSITDLVWTSLKASIEAGWNFAVGVLTAGLQLLRGDFELAWQTIGGTVSELGTAIVDGFLSIGPKVTQAAVDLLESAKQGIIGIMPSWVPLIGQEAEQVGQVIPASMGAGISGSLSMVTDKIHEITASVVTTLSEVIPFMGSIGIAIIKALGDGLIAGLSMIRTAGQSVVDTIVEPFSAVGGSVSRMYEGGRNTVMGFANGILGSLGLVESASSELASIPDDVVRNDLKIQSPSRVMEEIGGHVSQGLADGITGGSAAVAEAAQRIADEVDRSMSRIAEQIEQRYVLLTQGEEAARRYELAHRGIIGADQDLIIAGEAINRHLEEEKKLRDELQQGIQQSIVNADSVKEAFSNLGQFMTDWLKQKIAEFAANKLMMYMGLDGTGFEGGFGGIIKTVASGLGLLGKSATDHATGVSALAGNVDILGGNASGAMGAINLLSTGTGAAGAAASQAGTSFGVLASDANAVGTASAGAATALSTVVTVMGTVATANALSDKLHELAGVTDETASTIGKLAAGFGPVGAAIASAFGGAWEEVNKGFELAFKDGALSGQAVTYMEKERSLWRGTATSIIYSELDAALSETVVQYFGQLNKSVVSSATLLGVEGAATIMDGVEFAINTVKNMPVEEQITAWLEESSRQAWTRAVDQMAIGHQSYIGSQVNLYSATAEEIGTVVTRIATNFDVVSQAAADLNFNFDDTSFFAARASEALVELMGGLEGFQGAVSAYYNEFYTQEERKSIALAQAAVDTKALNDALIAAGMSTVSTKDEFKTLVEGLNLTTTAGQTLWAQAMQVAGSFADVATSGLSMQQIIDALPEGMRGSFQSLLDSSNTTAAGIQASTGVIGQAFAGAGVAMSGVATDVQTASNAMSGSSSTMSSEAQSNFAAMNSASVATLQSMSSSVQTLINGMSAGTVTAIGGMNAQTLGYIQSMSTGMLQSINNLSSVSIGSMSTMQAQSFAQVQTMTSGIAQALSNLSTQGTGQVAAMSTQSLAQIATMANSVIQQLSGMSSGSIGLSTQMRDQIIGQMVQLQSNATNAIASMQQNGTSSTQAMAGSVSNSFASMQGNVGNAAANINNSTAALAAGVNNSAGGIRGASITATNALGGMGGALYGIANVATSSLSTIRTALQNAGALTDSAKRLLSSLQTAVNGSHATGLDYVPFDGYVAELHKGEMVVPASVSNWLRDAGLPVQQPTAPPVGIMQARSTTDGNVVELQAIRKQLEAMQQQQAEESRAHEQALAALVSGSSQQVRTLKRVETANDRISRQLGR